MSTVKPKGMATRAAACFMALMLVAISTPARTPDKDQGENREKTRTPVKHLIVLIGENRSFDHLFATYVPKSQDSVKNLLSEGIIHADGTPAKTSKELSNSKRSSHSAPSTSSA